MLRGGSPWYEDEGRKEKEGEDLGLSTLSYTPVLFSGCRYVLLVKFRPTH